MINLLGEFGSYLKAIFIDGMNKVFTFFDLLGILLAVSPNFVEGWDVQTARYIAYVIFLISFVLANFNVYRKLVRNTLTNESLLIKQHGYPPNNIGEIKYIGPEIADDLNVVQIYIDTEGNEQSEEVTQFYPTGGKLMGANWSQNHRFLEPNQDIFFFLKNKKQTLDGKVTVHVNIKGHSSGKSVQKEEEFFLEDYEHPKPGSSRYA